MCWGLSLKLRPTVQTALPTWNCLWPTSHTDPHWDHRCTVWNIKMAGTWVATVACWPAQSCSQPSLRSLLLVLYSFLSHGWDPRVKLTSCSWESAWTFPVSRFAGTKVAVAYVVACSLAALGGFAKIWTFFFVCVKHLKRRKTSSWWCLFSLLSLTVGNRFDFVTFVDVVFQNLQQGVPGMHTGLAPTKTPVCLSSVISMGTLTYLLFFISLSSMGRG